MSETLLTKLFNQLPDPIWVIQQRQLVAANAAALAATGSTEARPPLEAALRQAVEQGTPWDLELPFVTAEGRRLYTGAAPHLPEAYTQAIEGTKIGPEVGSCGAAAFTGQRVIVADIATHPNWTAYRGLAAMAQVGACWSEPVLTLRQLRKAGMMMAIDDFGAGYAALSYLKHFKADFLKIDISFVRELGNNRETLALCVAIIAMAHKLAMQVIAQGVTTTAQRDCLLAAGCDCAQGDLFACPRPAAEIDW